jgi:hypothetical protein
MKPPLTVGREKPAPHEPFFVGRSDGSSSGFFPLTPTLSLGGREHRRQSLQDGAPKLFFGSPSAESAGTLC